MENGFYVIEGLDGSGKSSIAATLAQTEQVTTVESPPPPFAAPKKDVLNNAVAPARLLFFMAANHQVAHLAKRATDPNPFLAVRYIWSTLAYHAALEHTTVHSILDEIAPALRNLLMPQTVIYLTVSRETQLVRLGDRNETGLQGELNASDAFYERLTKAYDEAFAAVPAPVHRIDSSTQSLHETLAVVRELIIPELTPPPRDTSSNDPSRVYPSRPNP